MEQAAAVSVSGKFSIREAEQQDIAGWARLRVALWPDEDALLLAKEADDYFVEKARVMVTFLAFDDDGSAIGFAEATVRNDYVNGTQSSPVGASSCWLRIRRIAAPGR